MIRKIGIGQNKKPELLRRLAGSVGLLIIVIGLFSGQVANATPNPADEAKYEPECVNDAGGIQNPCYLPYFVAQGGDLAEGGGYSNTANCYVQGTTYIGTWNNDNDPSNLGGGYFGGATQGATYSTDAMQGMVTDLNSDTPLGGSAYHYSYPVTLGFANKQQTIGINDNGSPFYIEAYSSSDPWLGQYGGDFVNDTASGSNLGEVRSTYAYPLCIPDYYDTVMGEGPNPLPVTGTYADTVNLGKLSGGTYSFGSAGTPETLIINDTDSVTGLNDPISSTNGKITIAVYGNVYIESNIGYSYNWNPSTNSGSIPQFNLIVEGDQSESLTSTRVPTAPYISGAGSQANIYVQNNVSDIAGFYSVQSSSTHGYSPQCLGQENSTCDLYNSGSSFFYDCATGITEPNDSVTLSDYNDTVANGGCNNQLTVNGSVDADYFQLARTAGDLNAMTNGSTNTSNAAEVFKYSPELWIPDAGNTCTSGDLASCIGTTYTAETTLPPVL